MVQLSLAVNDYDRTSAIFDGRVRVEGCETHTIVLEAEEAFHRAFKFSEFDVTEMSLSSHAFVTASGTSAYIGIPAFVFRMFRHSGMYVRTDRGITRPGDLRGKTIGLAEYQQTANVWARGILAGIPHMTLLFESPPDDFGDFRAPRRPAWFARHETDQILGLWPPQNPAASS